MEGVKVQRWLTLAGVRVGCGHASLDSQGDLPPAHKLHLEQTNMFQGNWFSSRCSLLHPAASHTRLLSSLLISSSVGWKSAAERSSVQQIYSISITLITYSFRCCRNIENIMCLAVQTSSDQHIFSGVENRWKKPEHLQRHWKDFLGVTETFFHFSGHLCSLSAQDRWLDPMFLLWNSPKTVPLILRQNLQRPSLLLFPPSWL